MALVSALTAVAQGKWQDTEINLSRLRMSLATSEQCCHSAPFPAPPSSLAKPVCTTSREEVVRGSGSSPNPSRISGCALLFVLQQLWKNHFYAQNVFFKNNCTDLCSPGCLVLTPSWIHSAHKNHHCFCNQELWSPSLSLDSGSRHQGPW